MTADSSIGKDNPPIQNNLDATDLDAEEFRNDSIPRILEFFKLPDIQLKRNEIAQEKDPNKRAELIKSFAIQINSVVTTDINPSFGARVKVANGGSDIETNIDWLPPRPMDNIFNQYFTVIGSQLSVDEFSQAGLNAFKAISLGHPFRNGNGRTARLMFMFTIEPELTKNVELVTAYICNEGIQERSRTACKKALDYGIDQLKMFYKIDKLPHIFFPDSTGANTARVGGANTELKRLAAALIFPRPLDQNFTEIYEYKKMSPDDQKKLNDKFDELSRQLLINLINSQEVNNIIGQTLVPQNQ